jgi:TonB family protein
MRKTTISLITLLLMSATVLHAQENKPSQNPATAPAATESERPKSEVDRMIEDAQKRGETIILGCSEPCDDSPDGVLNGRALELPKPPYPAIAAAAHASGAVKVQVIIDVDGNVIAASAISGHPLLQAASVKAARGARFSPTKYNGEPVKVTGIIVYNFVSQ